MLKWEGMHGGCNNERAAGHDLVYGVDVSMSSFFAFLAERSRWPLGSGWATIQPPAARPEFPEEEEVEGPISSADLGEQEEEPGLSSYR